MELRRKPVCSRKVIENQELVVEKDKWKVYSENRNRKKREERRKNRVKREKLKKIRCREMAELKQRKAELKKMQPPGYIKVG